MKKIICILLSFVVAVSFAACGKSDRSEIDASEKAAAGNTKTISGKTKKKSVEKDDDLGLMNVKIHDTEGLSEIEELIVRYFDRDYFSDVWTEDLKRYPQIYKGSQIETGGTVFKTIESNDDSYTLLLDQNYNDNYVVIKGKQEDTRMIEGDGVFVYGKYTGLDTYTVDGKSYNVPTILVNDWVFAKETEGSLLYTMEDVRSIAKYLFGDDITIHDHSEDPDGDYLYSGEYYTVELENQSNANFTRYAFSAWRGGEINDLKSTSTEKRSITFSADFEHFYLQIFNTSLKTYTLSCYDLKLNKLWSRDFDGTTSALLDYTASHIYLLANGYMYILDTETGEDAVDKKYVGEKISIRKLTDGILLLSEGPSDAIMKTDLSGNVLWTVNTKMKMFFAEEDDIVVQIVGGNYVTKYIGMYDNGNLVTDDSDQPIEFAVVVSPDGKIIYEGNRIA